MKRISFIGWSLLMALLVGCTNIQFKEKNKTLKSTNTSQSNLKSYKTIDTKENSWKWKDYMSANFISQQDSNFLWMCVGEFFNFQSNIQKLVNKNGDVVILHDTQHFGQFTNMITEEMEEEIKSSHIFLKEGIGMENRLAWSKVDLKVTQHIYLNTKTWLSSTLEHLKQSPEKDYNFKDLIEFDKKYLKYPNHNTSVVTIMDHYLGNVLNAQSGRKKEKEQQRKNIENCAKDYRLCKSLRLQGKPTKSNLNDLRLKLETARKQYTIEVNKKNEAVLKAKRELYTLVNTFLEDIIQKFEECFQQDPDLGYQHIIDSIRVGKRHRNDRYNCPDNDLLRISIKHRVTKEKDTWLDYQKGNLIKPVYTSKL